MTHRDLPHGKDPGIVPDIRNNGYPVLRKERMFRRIGWSYEGNQTCRVFSLHISSPALM